MNVLEDMRQRIADCQAIAAKAKKDEEQANQSLRRLGGIQNACQVLEGWQSGKPIQISTLCANWTEHDFFNEDERKQLSNALAAAIHRVAEEITSTPIP